MSDARFTPRDREPVRMMTYSHDGFGLGHLRRNTAIATRFVREMPGSSVLMVAGCPLGPLPQMPAGVDFMKVPSIIKVNTGEWRPRTLQISSEETRALRVSTIQKAAEIFMPHIFLADYTPTGVWGELLPTLELFRRRANPPAVVLGLRDILDAPEVTRELWRRDGAYEAIRRYYDKVFIYGSRQIFDTATQYGLNGALRDKVEHCGYVCSEEASRPREEVRRELQTGNDKLVVVTAGGGCDAGPLMQACVEAVRLLAGRCPVEVVMITGPLMDSERRESLRRQAQGLPVRVLSYVEDSVSYMNAADLVITMAGYNTLLEAIRLGKRILVVPREGPSAEQRMRAEVFSRLGLVDAVSPAEASPAVIAQAIQKNLSAGPDPSSRLSPDGLATVARRLRSLLEPRPLRVPERSRARVLFGLMARPHTAW